MIWFTADQHFGHANIIKFTNRPFADVDEMDKHLIDRWNSSVASADTVYHLGDFTLGVVTRARHYFSQLNGKIYVLGNDWHHDRRWLPTWHIPGEEPRIRIGVAPFFSASSLRVAILPPLHVLEFSELGTDEHPLAVTLCHYPIAVWDRKHYGAWHLFGHSHGQHDNGGFSFDVGVDAHNYDPVSLDQVIWYMRERGWENPRKVQQ